MYPVFDLAIYIVEKLSQNAYSWEDALLIMASILAFPVSFGLSKAHTYLKVGVKWMLFWFSLMGKSGMFYSSCFFCPHEGSCKEHGLSFQLLVACSNEHLQTNWIEMIMDILGCLFHFLAGVKKESFIINVEWY